MVNSFGRPAPMVDMDAMEHPDRPVGVSAGTLRVDVEFVITPASLAQIEEQLAETIARAVAAGFARAAEK